jgi:hypothetical protein
MPSFTSLKAKENMQQTFDSMPTSSTTTKISPQELDNLSTKIEKIDLIEKMMWRNNPQIDIAQTQDSAMDAITMAQDFENDTNIECIINTITTAQESNEMIDISCITSRMQELKNNYDKSNQVYRNNLETIQVKRPLSNEENHRRNKMQRTTLHQSVDTFKKYVEKEYINNINEHKKFRKEESREKNEEEELSLSTLGITIQRATYNYQKYQQKFDIRLKLRQYKAS